MISLSSLFHFVGTSLWTHTKCAQVAGIMLLAAAEAPADTLHHKRTLKMNNRRLPLTLMKLLVWAHGEGQMMGDDPHRHSNVQQHWGNLPAFQWHHRKVSEWGDCCNTFKRWCLNKPLQKFHPGACFRKEGQQTLSLTLNSELIYSQVGNYEFQFQKSWSELVEFTLTYVRAPWL